MDGEVEIFGLEARDISWSSCYNMVRVSPPAFEGCHKILTASAGCTQNYWTFRATIATTPLSAIFVVDIIDDDQSLDGESEQVRLGGGIDISIELDNLFRLMPLLLLLPLSTPELPEVTALVIALGIAGRHC
jgi:hypothetical protein